MTNDKPRFHSWLAALGIFLPLLTPLPGLSALSLSIDGYYIPPQTLLCLIAVVVMASAIFVSREKIRLINPKSLFIQFKAVLFLLAFVGVYSLVLAAEGDRLLRFSIQFATLVVPFLYATCVVTLVMLHNVDTGALLQRAAIAVAIYLSAVLAYNVVAYGFPFQSDSLYAPGGRVVFGYTVCMLGAFLLLAKKSCNEYAWYNIIALLLAFCGIATQSRVAAWLSILLCLLCIIPKKRADLTVLFTIGFILVFLISDPFQLLADYSSRLFNGEDTSRASTWANAFNCFSDSDLVSKLLGYGIGGVFPYQEWQSGRVMQTITMSWTDETWNTFLFDGYRMLVEPHNVFVWILLEMGLLGFVSFLLLLGYYVRSFLHNRSVFISPASCLVCLVVFIFVNLFDALIFTNAISSTWWCILLLPLSFQADAYTKDPPHEN